MLPRSLLLKGYPEQRAEWPRDGRHILAHFDESTIVVYQAYRPEIGRYAVEHQRLGGPHFKLERMSWIKPGFLWMMFRSGWGTKEGQEVVLAIHLRREAFTRILAQAVASKFVPELYATPEEWSRAVRHSNVRLQWDPDHGPGGQPVTRRAIQLGLQGEVLRQFASEWIVQIEDISAFVQEQREHRGAGGAGLLLPYERVYPVAEPEIAARLRLSSPGP